VDPAFAGMTGAQATKRRVRRRPQGGIRGTESEEFAVLRAEIRIGLATAALAASLGAALAAEEREEDYPPGSGRELAFTFCSACHGFKIVAAQGMTRELWDDALRWMSVKHNMPPLDGKEREEILSYLASAFPPRPARGGQNPFAPPQ
jgi:mono/diheme cytochrome c family protein